MSSGGTRQPEASVPFHRVRLVAVDGDVFHAPARRRRHLGSVGVRGGDPDTHRADHHRSRQHVRRRRGRRARRHVRAVRQDPLRDRTAPEAAVAVPVPGGRHERTKGICYYRHIVDDDGRVLPAVLRVLYHNDKSH